MGTEKDIRPSFAQVIIEALRSESMSLKVSLPAIVTEADNSKQKCSVQPMIQKKYNDEEKGRNLPILQDVPVQYSSGNSDPTTGIHRSGMHLPLSKGDKGALIFSDRSLDNFLASDGKKPILPDDYRAHDISDATFIPGINPWSKALDWASSTNMTIKHDQMKITLDPSGRITLEGASNEVMEVISTFMSNIINAKVVTALGPMPFDPATLINFNIDKTKWDSLKG